MYSANLNTQVIFSSTRRHHDLLRLPLSQHTFILIAPVRYCHYNLCRCKPTRMVHLLVGKLFSVFQNTKGDGLLRKINTGRHTTRQFKRGCVVFRWKWVIFERFEKGTRSLRSVEIIVSGYKIPVLGEYSLMSIYGAAIHTTCRKSDLKWLLVFKTVRK